MSRKFSLEEVQQLFRDGDATLLADRYVNCMTKMSYRCHRCNSNASVSLNDFQTGRRSCCGQASGVEKRRFTLDKARVIFDQGDAVLLADHYASSTTKMSYHCRRCNNNASVSLTCFQNGVRPCCGRAHVAEKQRLPLDEVCVIFKQGDAELLADHYVNSRTKMPYRCHRCNSNASVSLNDFRRGRRPCCGRECGVEKRRFTLDEARVIFDQGDAELLADHYVGIEIKMPYRCRRCNGTASVSLHSFQIGQRPCCGQQKGPLTRRKNYRRNRARKMARLLLVTGMFFSDSGEG